MGKTLTEVLSTYKLSDETFAHEKGGLSNDIATEQALLAMTAYNFYVEGKGSVYNIKSVSQVQNNYVSKFTDISEYTWAETQINYLAQKGIITGVSESLFAPANNIKRADYICLLVKALNLKADVDSNFDDVLKDKYYYNAVGVAKQLGLINGVGDNMFAPETSITRQDMFVIAYNAFKLLEVKLSIADVNVIEDFDDYEQIAQYSKNAFAIFVDNKIVSGWNNKLNPTKNTTRAECAVFIYQLEQIINK